jgi:hypothetical protein
LIKKIFTSLRKKSVNLNPKKAKDYLQNFLSDNAQGQQSISTAAFIHSIGSLGGVFRTIFGYNWNLTKN